MIYLKVIFAIFMLVVVRMGIFVFGYEWIWARIPSDYIQKSIPWGISIQFYAAVLLFVFAAHVLFLRSVRALLGFAIMSTSIVALWTFLETHQSVPFGNWLCFFLPYLISNISLWIWFVVSAKMERMREPESV